MDYVKDVRELHEAGFSNKKIARIVYGDAHPFCVELVELDLFEVQVGAFAHFLNDVFGHQEQMEMSAFFSNKVMPLIPEDMSDEEVELEELE